MMRPFPVSARSGTWRRLRRAAARFSRDHRGTTAVEFGAVAALLVSLLMAVLQFSLYFLCQMSMHNALADIATGANTAALSSQSSINGLVCDQLVLADSCSSTLLVEKAPLANFPAAAQPVTGASFANGTTGVMMLIRAKANVVTFIPGFSTLTVSAAAVYASP